LLDTGVLKADSISPDVIAVLNALATTPAKNDSSNKETTP
jgi:hypothetical protein